MKVRPNAVVLWTGGKDSSLAFYEAAESGYVVKALVTFVPRNPLFLAHPLPLMTYQAEAIGLPHEILEVIEPFKDGYQKALSSLRDKYGITHLVTGDIAEVDHCPNWIKACSSSLGLRVVTPLWGRDRYALIEKLLRYNFQVIFSCVQKPWFSAAWLGRELDGDALDELVALHRKTGLDLCGEQGEYHTFVLDGPLFQRRIQVEVSPKTKGPFLYLHLRRASFLSKGPECCYNRDDENRLSGKVSLGKCHLGPSGRRGQSAQRLVGMGAEGTCC